MRTQVRRSAHQNVAGRSDEGFRMRRMAVFILLTVLSVAWSMPAEAQSKRVARYGHQSQKAAQKAAEKQQKENEKAARKQQKTIKKYEKKQRRAAKNANHHSRSARSVSR